LTWIKGRKDLLRPALQNFGGERGPPSAAISPAIAARIQLESLSPRISYRIRWPCNARVCRRARLLTTENIFRDRTIAADGLHRWQASRIRSSNPLPSRGFSTIGTSSLAARALSAALRWLTMRTAGVRTLRSRSLAISSIPLIPGIRWSTTKQLQSARSPASRSSAPLA